MHARLTACNACRSVHNCISRMGCEMPSHNTCITFAVHLAKGGDSGDCFNYRPLTLLPILTGYSPSSSWSGLHVLYSSTTSDMRSSLAEARSIYSTTCWQLCGNESRLTKPSTRAFLTQQKPMTQYRHSPAPPSSPMRCHGTRLCSTVGNVRVGIQQGVC